MTTKNRRKCSSRVADNVGVVQYGDTYFYVGTAIGDSKSSPEYPDVLALDRSLDGSELTLTVTNEADQ